MTAVRDDGWKCRQLTSRVAAHVCSTTLLPKVFAFHSWQHSFFLVTTQLTCIKVQSKHVLQHMFAPQIYLSLLVTLPSSGSNLNYGVFKLERLSAEQGSLVFGWTDIGGRGGMLELIHPHAACYISIPYVRWCMLMYLGSFKIQLLGNGIQHDSRP